MKKTCKIEIDCANCARKVEDAMCRVPGVTDVRVNFLTQRMTLEAADAGFDAVFQAAVAAGKKAEPDFAVK